MFQLQSIKLRLTSKSLNFLTYGLLAITVFSCQKGAGSAAEAKERLLAAKSWKVNEIYVDDVVRFKEGKLIPHFGGVDFGRYMEYVRFGQDGLFEGYYKGEEIPLKLKYKVNSESITLIDADPAVKSGEWLIVPSSVRENEFEMTTVTKAYNYPATTTLRLLFTNDK